MARTTGRHSARAALAITAFVLTGCATLVGPDFTTPQTPEVKAWLVANTPDPQPGTGLTTRSAPVTDWWATFNDPTLNRLIAEAYAQNLSLQIAGARVRQARAQLGIAAGEVFPQQQAVGASVSYRKISENLQIINDIEQVTNVDPTFTTGEIGFDATWELDVWGGLRRNVQSAGANLTAQIANYDDALITVTGDVAAIYINIRALQEALAITRANIELQQEGLRLAELRFQNGVTTELDVQQATALLNDTRALVPSLETELQQSKNALAVLLAKPPATMNAQLGRGGSIPVARSQVGVGIPAELLRRRPDIRAAEMEAAAQSAQIGVAMNALYPQFALAGSIGWQASGGKTLFSPQSVTGAFTPQVGWNVLNYGRIKNNVEAQQAAFEGLVANYQNTVLSAYGEVENAMVAYRGAGAQVGYLSKSVAAAKRAADISLQQYTDGIADYQRVIDSQRALLGSEANLVEARSAVSENLVTLYKALGGGWQIRRGGTTPPKENLIEMAYRTDWDDLNDTAAR
ncbi:MAG: efflux transporter outer membrane subunit [Rhodobacteraceae bacterium]|nr:efflux transporter outer membrane subunit [Paracoccaceae bacterium]